MSFKKERRIKLVIGIFLALVAIVSLVGCISKTENVKSIESQVEQPVVKVGYYKAPHNIPAMVLPRFGNKYGVNITLIQFTRYADVQLALVNGDIDFGTTGYHLVLAALDKNIQKFKVISGMSMGGQCLIARSDLKINKWKDIEGKKIGMASNAAPEMNLRWAASKNGVDFNKIERVSFTTTGPPMISALKNKEIDLLAAWEPWCATAAVEGYGYYSLDILDNPTRGIYGVLAVNNEFAQKNNKTVVAVVKAFIDATNYMNVHTDEEAKVLSEETGVALPVAIEAVNHTKLDTNIYYEPFKEMAKGYYDSGLTKMDTTNNISSMLEYRYLRQVTGKEIVELGGRNSSTT